MLAAGAFTSVLVALVSYLPTVAPTISWANGGADSGDLATAVLAAGIPHPPGYPTYLLLGLVWTRLLPESATGADVAHRLALLSAFGAACSAGLTAATIVQLASVITLRSWVRVAAGVYGGLLLAWSPLLWSQATIAEVYAPGLVWVALVGLLLLGRRPLTARRAILAAFIGGLGFGALPQIALAGPGALGLVLVRFGRPFALVRCLLSCGLATGLGLLTLLYLPLRAAADPPANWGDPSSFARFRDVVTAAEYRYVLGLLGPPDVLPRLQEGLYQLGQNLRVVGALFALVAVRLLWGIRRPETVYLLGLLGLTLVVRTLYPAEGNLVYLIPALYAATILAGLGLAGLLARLLALTDASLGVRAGRWRGAFAAGALTFALLALLVRDAVGTAKQVDASGDWAALVTANRLLAEAPPRALLLSTTDETTFALWYAQALGARPDVVVVDERLLARDWYRAQLGRRHADLDLSPAAPDRLAARDRPRLAVDGPPRVARLRPIP